MLLVRNTLKCENRREVLYKAKKHRVGRRG